MGERANISNRDETRQATADNDRLCAIREKYRDRPSPDQLMDSGDFEPPVLHGPFVALQAFVRQLKQERERAGLSLSDMEERTGIDRSALSRFENGRNPNPKFDLIGRYAAALDKLVILQIKDMPESL
jgi:DNA-binding XRE family transcriptional regulator